MEFLTPPWKHQKEAIKRAASERDFALLHEAGTGKTGTMINILRQKYNENKSMMKTLILCPPIVVSNWKSEFTKHSKIPPAKIGLLTGSQRQRLDKLRRMQAEGATIFVTNYESLLMRELFNSIKAWGPEIVVYDESHKLKDPKTKRSKAAQELSAYVSVKGPDGKVLKEKGKPVVGRRVKHAYLLTGTPILNSPMDIFGQYLVLDGGDTFGRNFYAFRARHFRDRNAGMPKGRYFPDWVPMEGELAVINKLIATKGMRVLKSECLDLPPLVQQSIKVGMTAEQKRLYDEMKRDLVTFFNDKACTATMALTRALRLMQIASGYIKTIDEEEFALSATPKQDALKELLEQLTPAHKVLVWAAFRQNYAQIRQVCEELGLKHVEIHGEVSTRQKDAAVDALNNDPKTRVLIGHPGSGGIGVNLIAASYSIFYSRSFSLEHSLQAEARNYRGGSEIHERITRIDLVTENTIEESVLEKLISKQEISDKLLRSLKL